MKNSEDYQWFIVVDDPITNEIVAAELARLNESSGNDVTFRDGQGILRNGWRVRFYVLNMFLKASLHDNRIKFVPYVKEGNGKPRTWRLPGKKITQRSRKLRKVKKKLSEIQKSK